MNVFKLPTHRRIESHTDTDDGDRLFTKTIHHPNIITLPIEYESYLKRRGTIYRVELSQSGHSWILSVDSSNDHAGWDQPGWYLKTLVLRRNGNLEEAVRRARSLLPDEPAFFVQDGFLQERLSDDDAFDKWFSSL